MDTIIPRPAPGKPRGAQSFRLIYLPVAK